MTLYFVLKFGPNMVSTEFFVKCLETNLSELCHPFILLEYNLSFCNPTSFLVLLKLLHY